ncbi:MAG: PAS domain-containing protein [Sphingomonas sp.]|nr:PAS domain-containing protein [Sphingomonas sp.]
MTAHIALRNSLADSPIAMVATNPRHPDNVIEVANRAFCALSGYSEAEIIGRNCRFMSGKDSDPAAIDRMRVAIREKRPALIEILNYRKDGSTFLNGVMIAPLFDNDGQLTYFLGSQVDLGKAAGEAMPARTARASQLVRQLPGRQREVLGGMAEGLLNKQIAYRLGIAEKTVKMHRSLLLERLGKVTSAEAIRIAVEAGL